MERLRYEKKQDLCPKAFLQKDNTAQMTASGLFRICAIINLLSILSVKNSVNLLL
jgi:hypothetical protein